MFVLMLVLTLVLLFARPGGVPGRPTSAAKA
jgi:hypothetical protein